MKKKIFSLVICVVLLVCISGCGNNKLDNSNDNSNNSFNNNSTDNSNNKLVCMGKISFMQDIYIQKKGLDSGGIDENPENWKIGFVTTNENIESGKYTFVYNNNKLQSIKVKEVYKASLSNDVTDQEMQEMQEETNMKVYKDKNNRINFEYTLDENDDIFKALNVRDNLKENLEEHANLTCEGKIVENNNNKPETKPDTKEPKTLKCNGKVYYAYEEYNFNFIYDSSKKDYILNNVQKNLTIPDGYDANEYYIEEEKSNMGQYEMNLNGRIITFKLDKARPYWDDYKFKNYTYKELKKEFSSDGYTCE